MSRSASGRKRGGQSRYLNGSESKLMRPSQPGDELQGAWTRKALLEMNARFVAAMEKAIARGLERRPDDLVRAT
jgi:hypothetical protein